jgi:XTP/dITP diphosphohydrolase
MRKESIIVATHNKNKLLEMTDFLNGLGINVYSLDDFPGIGEISETGGTLEENALIKAKAVFEITNIPSLSDDTGLEVFGLNGEPGVYSARWAGENCSYSDNVNKMLSEIKTVPKGHRSAQFRTVMAFVDNSLEHLESGIIKGEILEEAKGVGGFGYDPVFYIPSEGKTFAEMSKHEKGKISHRGIALSKMLNYLKKYFDV